MSTTRGTRMLNPSTGKPRVCLVTGSSSPYGLGHAMVQAFAREGGSVVVSDIAKLEEQGKKVVADIESKWGAGTAIWVPLDVTKEEEWKTAIAQIESVWGPLDVLCNNAGIGHSFTPEQLAARRAEQAAGKLPTLDQLDFTDFSRVMDVNVNGVAYGCKYGAESMKKNEVAEWKSIINTSSVAGLSGNAAFSYSVSKWAVRGLTKCAAVLGAPLKIRVNSIHPGAIKSEMTKGADWLDDEFNVKEGVGKMLAAQHLVGRFGEPDEVAAVCLLLAGNEGAFLTGQQWVIDGGLNRS